MQNKPSKIFDMKDTFSKVVKREKLDKIDFIIGKCGGNSLQHVLAELGNCFWLSVWLGSGFLYIGETRKEQPWQLLIDTKEAKLQDQSPETLNSLATILGYENGN